MLVDYHIHLEGRYEKERVGKYIEIGLRRGVKEFGIAEHIHRFKESKDIPDRIIERFGRNQDTVFMREWWGRHCTRRIEEYVEFVQTLKDDGYPVKLGCELDFLPDVPVHSFVGDWPWDFITGSVHWIEGWGFDHLNRKSTWGGRDIDLAYRKYFNLVKDAAESGLFDVIGHIDVIKVFGHYPIGEWSSWVDDALVMIAEKKMSVEVNTAGLRKPVGEMYPSKSILKRCRELEIQVTLSSDAHRPEDVGHRFDEALLLLQEAGYDSLTGYSRRKPVQLSFRDSYREK